MLESLPIEIILSISRYLNFCSKSKLAQTSSKLRRIIYNTVLFEEIKFTTESAQKIILRFKEKQLDGSLVKTCHINPNTIGFILLSEFPKIFPNLKKVILPNSFLVPSPSLPKYKHEYIKALQDKIQVCHMWVGGILSVFDLNPNFTALKRLTLNCHPVLLSGVTKDCVFDTVSFHLKNSPLLESLSLFYFEINPTVIDNLHTHNSKLKHLVIHSTAFKYDTSRQDPQIKRVHSLESIELSDKNGFTKDACYMIEYMFKKYQNLKSLALNMKSDDLVVDPILFKLLETYFSQLDILKIDLNLIKYFKGHQARLFVTDLSSLMIPMNPLVNILPTTQRLLDIQAFTGVRSLVLPLGKVSPIYCKGIILPNIKCLRLFEKNLITDMYPVVELDKLLYTYSNLEEIETKSQQTYVTSGIYLDWNYAIRYPSLRKMKLDIQDIGLYFSEFLANCLPNLRYLDLSTYKAIIINLELPHHTLYSLNLDVFRKNTIDTNWRYHYRISTEIGVKDIYYNHQAPDKIKVTNQVIDNKSVEKGKIIITCKKLFELKYNDQVLV